jgi:hypothetical protein
MAIEALLHRPGKSGQQVWEWDMSCRILRHGGVVNFLLSSPLPESMEGNLRVRVHQRLRA